MTYKPFDKVELLPLETWQAKTSAFPMSQFDHIVKTWNSKMETMVRVRMADDIREIPSKLPYKSTLEEGLISVDSVFWQMLNDRKPGILL